MEDAQMLYTKYYYYMWENVGTVYVQLGQTDDPT